MLAAWFGGQHEKASDVGIWGSRLSALTGRWSEPELWADVPGVPCWNPVLFRDASGVVWLFYRVGPEIGSWTGCFLQSRDEGCSWSAAHWLPAGLLGPIKNKPIQMSNGEILCPSSVESYATWTAWVEVIAAGVWTRFGPLSLPGGARDARASHGLIQPTLWESGGGKIHALLRSSSDIRRICRSDSHDFGRTWTPAAPTSLPNPNSGIDAVRLNDGRIVLAYNPTESARTPLSLAVSEDNGESWKPVVDLETGDGEFSYPAIVQSSDGLVHVVYTHQRRRIAHAIVEA